MGLRFSIYLILFIFSLFANGVCKEFSYGDICINLETGIGTVYIDECEYGCEIDNGWNGFFVDSGDYINLNPYRECKAEYTPLINEVNKELEFLWVKYDRR